MSFNVGYTTNGAGNAGGSGTGVADTNGPYTMPSDGVIQTISMYSSASGALILGVYDTSGGTPHTLLATTASFTAAAGGWNTIATTTNPTITSGTVINLAFIIPSGSGAQMHFDNPNVGFTWWLDGGGESVLPATYTGSPTPLASYQWSLYATFNPTATTQALVGTFKSSLEAKGTPSGVVPLYA